MEEVLKQCNTTHPLSLSTLLLSLLSSPYITQHLPLFPLLTSILSNLQTAEVQLRMVGGVTSERLWLTTDQAVEL